MDGPPFERIPAPAPAHAPAPAPAPAHAHADPPPPPTGINGSIGAMASGGLFTVLFGVICLYWLHYCSRVVGPSSRAFAHVTVVYTVVVIMTWSIVCLCNR